MKHINRYISVLVVLILSACGGGGGDTPKKDLEPQPTKTYFSVKTQATTGGSISPSSVDVEEGKTTSFNLTANENFIISEVSGCGGTLDGNTYTTGSISAACEVQASFVKTSTVSGVAQLGLISGATVKLFELPEMTLIAETQSSSSAENYGAFSFSNVVLDSDTYYFIESVGGIDTDPNNDGVVINEDNVDIKGSVKAISSGKNLLNNVVRITALSDLLVTFISTDKNAFENVSSSLLDEISQNLIQDINDDEVVTVDDVLLFNPLEHTAKLKINYNDFAKGHINNIHNNLSNNKVYYDLLALLPPEFHIVKGHLQKIPFVLNVSLNNIPKALSTKWFLDGVAFDPLTLNEVSTKGDKLLEAQLFVGIEHVKTISTVISAHTTKLVKEENIQPDLGGEILLNEEISSPELIGTSITIPGGALSQTELISIHESSSNKIPNTGHSLSPVLTFEPAGLVFNDPVVIGLPVHSDVTNYNDTLIARTDENGTIDYLTPLRFDEEKRVIYFETEHFSSYAVINKQVKDALTDGYGDPLLTSIVDDINIRFAGAYPDLDSNSDWLPYLATEIASIDGANLTIFGTYQAMIEAEKVNKKIACNGQYSASCNDNAPTILDAPYRGYTAAFEAMYGEKAIPQGGVVSEWEFAKKMISSPAGTLLGEVEKQYFTDDALSTAYFAFKSVNSAIGDAEAIVATADQTVQDVFQHRFPIDLSEGNIINKILSLYLDSALSIGGSIITASSDIKMNVQIALYFQYRQTYSAQYLMGKLQHDESIDGQEITSGWFSNGNMPSGDLPSNFWHQVEGLYISDLAFKGDSVALKAERDAKLKTLLDSTITLHNTEIPDNNYYIESYQVNDGGIIEHGKYSSKSILVSTQPNDDFIVYFNLKVEGESDYISSFAPDFFIDSEDDNLYGLTYEMYSAVNLGDDKQRIGVKFIAPSQKKTYEYEVDFKYKQSIMFDFLNDGKRLTITVENENIAPEVNIDPEQKTTIKRGELADDLVEIHATAHDIDGVIDSYRWELQSDQEMLFPQTDIRTLRFIIPEIGSPETVIATVFVTDNDGAVSSKSIELTLKPTNKPPVAHAGEDQFLFAGTSATLSASQSYDEDGEILSYQWFYNGSVIGTTSSMELGVVELGIHKYILKITDDSGESRIDGVKVVIYNNESDLDDDEMPDAWEVEHGLDPSIDDSALDADGDGRTNLQEFLDGTLPNVDDEAPQNQVPVAHAGSDQTVMSGDQVTLDASESSDHEDESADLSFSWSAVGSPDYLVELENSSSMISTFTAPTVTKATVLAFEVTVKDKAGDSAIDTVSITVEAPEVITEPLFVSLNPASVVSGTQNVTFTITGENLPSTLAMAIENVNSCSVVTVVNITTANITCDIPTTNESQLAFYIKDKPGAEGGNIIAGAETLMLNVSVNDGNGFIQPCRDCGYSGPFDRDWHGDNTTHLAKDYPAFVGDNVLAIARGQVVKVLTNAAGFGGSTPSLPGGAIVVMHTKTNGDNFYALYGHVNASADLNVEDIVSAGEVLGTVDHYFVGTVNGQEDWPHLHFGIWDAETNFPTTNLGYGTDRSFVNPVPFLDNNQPEMLTELYGVTPETAIAGQNTIFTVTGKSIPDSIALSLGGSESCDNISNATTSSATISCIPNTPGLQRFYAKNKTGGVFLRGSESMLIDVQTTPQAAVVLGVSFTDENFATCVQEHVASQQVTDLASLTTLDCNNRNISNVAELSYMAGLVSLYLQNNPITEVNLDANQALDTVNLLNTSLSQSSVDYLATVTWIANLTYPSSEPQPEESDAFITTWRVEDNQQINIPIVSDYTYNYTVDWGDGSAITTESGSANHSYVNGGEYTVKILGDFPAIKFLSFNTSKDLIYSVDQWGMNSWKSMDYAFSYCTNLTLNATDSPDLSDVTDMSNMFLYASSLNGDISRWDVSNVTNMSSMFAGASSFNGDVSSWDVSNVTNMSRMFLAASSFNGDVSSWDVSNVADMSAMFNGVSSFNRDISNWSVNKVTDMSSMFGGASIFNRNLSNWDVSSVSNMSFMFYEATTFNGDISSWDVSKVSNMRHMFIDTPSFNGDISGWNVSSVTDMSYMFYKATSFNSNISNWDVSSVTNMTSMFYTASSFSGDISNWEVGNVTDMSSMFDRASSFNSDISSWDVSNVTKMNTMFSDASLFNSDISNWNVNKVMNMYGMFVGASQFNSDISSWDVGQVTNMSFMFYSATNFTGDLSNWNVENVTSHSQFSTGSSLIEPIWP